MNRVKEFREKRGLTQKQLGVAIGKYQIWIYKLEYERRVPDELERKKLSEVLGVAAEELFPPEKPEVARLQVEAKMAGLATQP